MTRKPSSISGLYAITPTCADTVDLVRRVTLALKGGARVVQYRDKSANAALRLGRAQALRELTQKFDAAFIVNDDVSLALAADADGVHLGESDQGLGEARAILGQDKIIGISCYNRMERARYAAHAGADYIAFGAFFSSVVKPDAPLAGINLLQQAKAELDLPVVAIGGINPQNGAALVQAGADALAVISAVFGSPDIRAAAEKMTRLFIRH